MSSRTTDVDVTIVGAGVAGLAAAYDLHRARARVLVCEAAPRPGGLVHTEHAEGCLIEAGPDAMLAQKRGAIDLCHELGLGADVIPTSEPRTAFVVRDGTLHPLPAESILGLPASESAVAAFGMLSAEGRARLARDFTDPAPPMPDGRDESVGSLIARRLGPEATRFIAQPLLGGIHAGDANRLSARALFPMLAEADARDGSLLAHLASRRGRPDPEGAFRGLRLGMSTLVNRLVTSLPRGVMALGTPVLEVSGGAPYVVTTPSGRHRTRAVVLALPAWAAARVVAGLDAELARACAEIPYTSTATITLAYARADVGQALGGTGFVVPRGETSTRLLAASWVTSKWPDRAPSDLVVVRAFAGGVLDADLLQHDDAGLAAMAHHDLAGLLSLRAPPRFTRVFRWVDAGAQYEVGHAARVAAVDAGEERRPGLFLTGSAYRGVGLPDCITDARRVASRVAAWLTI